MRRGVLIEGHFRDTEEIKRIVRGVSDLGRSCGPAEIVRLEGDAAKFARRLAASPLRVPGAEGPGTGRKDP